VTGIGFDGTDIENRLYVGRSVEATTEVLWEAYGKTSPQKNGKQEGKQEVTLYVTPAQNRSKTTKSHRT
jgi:hypothetical protein